MKTRDSQAKQEALEIIDDVLYTDYHEVIRKEERGNVHQLGMLGKLNTYYFDQFLKPSFELKEEYRGEHEQIKTDFLAMIDAMNEEQLSLIHI